MAAWGNAAKSCNALLTRVERNDPTLIDLIVLPSKTFGDAEVDRLALAIPQNTHLRSISASGHVIRPSSLQNLGSSIAATAKAASSLTRIAIGDEHMGDDGVIAFCANLEQTHGGPLQSVDLEFKGIPSSNHLDGGDGSSMEALGKTFGASSHLQRLNLARNENLDNAAMEEFCNSATAVCAKQSNATTPFSQLTHLDFSECQIGPTGVFALSKLLVPREGATSNNDNNKQSASRLSLLLNGNPLGPTGLVNLHPIISSGASSCLLQSLLLKNCNIGDEGVIRLATVVRSSACNGLTVLDLSNNAIGPKGANALADTLWNRENQTSTCWTTLTDLRLAGNPLQEDGVKSVVGALAGRKPFTDSGSNSDNDNIENIAGNTTVHTLDLCQTGGGKGGAAAALSCGKLTSLRLFNNKLGTEGFQKLAPLLRGGHPSLEALDLGGNDAAEPAVVELLASLAIIVPGSNTTTADSNKLRVLEIGGNDGGFGVEEAVEKLREVRSELDVARDRPRQDPNA